MNPPSGLFSSEEILFLFKSKSTLNEKDCCFYPVIGFLYGLQPVHLPYLHQERSPQIGFSVRKTNLDRF